MSLRSFLIPQLSLTSAGLKGPTSVGEQTQPAPTTPAHALSKWHADGVRLAVVRPDGVAAHSIKSAGVETVLDGVSIPELGEWAKAGWHDAIIDHSATGAADFVATHGLKRLWVRIQLHQGFLQSHPEADGADLWEVVDEITRWQPSAIVVSDSDHSGAWHTKSVKALSAICEYTKLPVVATSVRSTLEDIHQLNEVRGVGLAAAIVSDGFSQGFTFGEAVSALQARYDPYEWGPPLP